MKGHKEEAGPPLALNGWSDAETGLEGGSVFENSLVAMRALVMHDVPTDMDPPDAVFPPVLVIPCAKGASASPCHSAGSFQESPVWHTWSLVDQNVQGFLKDPGLGELHLHKWGRKSNGWATAGLLSTRERVQHS